MKKITFILVAIFILYGCDNSIESRIKKEFKTYIKNNFDNPNLVKEIVSVEAADTISNRANLVSIKKVLSLSEESDSLSEYLLQKNKNFHLKRELEYNDRRIVNESINFILDHIIDANIAKRTLKDYVDSFKLMIPKYGYKIKYRVKVGDELQMKEYYAYRDSATNEIKFQDHLYAIKDMPENEYEIMKNMPELLDIITKCSECYVKTFDIIKKYE